MSIYLPTGSRELIVKAVVCTFKKEKAYIRDLLQAL